MGMERATIISRRSELISVIPLDFVDRRVYMYMAVAYRLGGSCFDLAAARLTGLNDVVARPRSPSLLCNTDSPSNSRISGNVSVDFVPADLMAIASSDAYRLPRETPNRHIGLASRMATCPKTDTRSLSAIEIGDK